MKTYVELGLAALLAVLVYEKPAFLVNIANSTLGIVVMIVTVAVLAKQFGINAGLLAAIIMILLQESYREGAQGAQQLADRDCGGDAWDSGKAGAGCARNSPNTVSRGNKKIGESCYMDWDCLPGQKKCTTTKNDNGTPKQCATKSVCQHGKCQVLCQQGQCPTDEGATSAGQQELNKIVMALDKKHEVGSDESFIGGMREGYTSTRISLRPSSFPVTGTDQITLSRMLKVNALHAKNAASQQANGCTNNGGGIAF